jgi:ATP-dependent DNA helicase DinG
MANSPKVDFQITNHNYLIADRIHRATGKRPLIPNYQLVVIDEAHKFLQAARSMYGMELDDREIPKLTRDIHAFTSGKSNSGVNVHKLAKKLEGQNSKLFRRLNENIPESAFEDDESDRFPAVIDSDVARHLKSIAGLSIDINAAVADSNGNKRMKDKRAKSLWRLGMVVEKVTGLRKQGGNIYWLENRLDGEIESQALCSIPKDLDMRLHRDFWKSGIPIVLTSGTLSASGDFTRAKETLGLNRLQNYKLHSTTMPSPFDFKNNAMLYISEDTPFPDNKDKNYIAAIADEIERLVIASHGHAAVLFTSYNAMGQVHAILKKKNLPFSLFRLERGSTNAIEQFKKSGNGILLASGALWEGIDIPGDTLSMLIIVKLPFAVPDPIGDYERELYGDMETYKARVIVPDMLVKLKQGFGRLIRKMGDTGVVAILDSRVNSRGAYRYKVLKALPSCPVTSTIAKVKAFFHAIKSANYFENNRRELPHE